MDLSHRSPHLSDSINKMYSTFRIPRLHSIPRIHTESLVVFLAFRKSFLTLSDCDRARYGKKSTRDAFLNSFAPLYIEQHLHGISFKRMCDLVQDIWNAKHFLPGSDLNKLLDGASFERQQDAAFRRLINVPLIGEALETNTWISNHQLNYKPRLTPSCRIRKLLSTRPHLLPREQPAGLNFDQGYEIEEQPVSGPFKPFLGPYEGDYECSTALPFTLQHPILTAIQDLIEESLYSFACQYFQPYLALNFKTCPKSIELSTWKTHLHMNAPNIRFNLTSGYVLEDLHFFLDRLNTVRDLVMHRKDAVPIEAINSMCADSICLARALGDPRAVLLGLIQERVLMISETLLRVQTLPQHTAFLGLENDLNMKSNLQFFVKAISASRILLSSSEAWTLYSERYQEIVNMLRHLVYYNEEKRRPAPPARFYYGY
ncbi:uncharacterized protein EAF01_009296 [Botrytis porri]|uniref:Uncharacterized protein n=1 Tax=Botrytis porri TaxID=87229 RepID=A0A4Z1KJK4_9HELO|nr:uncharacterized protein EAF01_009296 [Botrytis porri]KAF7896893.1 hypothetical protein EAF01_009296 [Botrytis porri]TGO85680.1 hypothetical protein BPOR_0374g00140 [Botrytis porri]